MECRQGLPFPVRALDFGVNQWSSRKIREWEIITGLATK